MQSKLTAVIMFARQHRRLAKTILICIAFLFIVSPLPLVFPSFFNPFWAHFGVLPIIQSDPPDFFDQTGVTFGTIASPIYGLGCPGGAIKSIFGGNVTVEFTGVAHYNRTTSISNFGSNKAEYWLFCKIDSGATVSAATLWMEKEYQNLLQPKVGDPITIAVDIVDGNVVKVVDIEGFYFSAYPGYDVVRVYSWAELGFSSPVARRYSTGWGADVLMLPDGRLALMADSKKAIGIASGLELVGKSYEWSLDKGFVEVSVPPAYMNLHRRDSYELEGIYLPGLGMVMKAYALRVECAVIKHSTIDNVMNALQKCSYIFKLSSGYVYVSPAR